MAIKIEEEDFILTSCGESSPHFDLELLKTINKGKDNERKEFQICAYGCTLESAIKRIAHYRVSNKHKEEAIRLVTYFKDFKKELDSLKELINGNV